MYGGISKSTSWCTITNICFNLCVPQRLEACCWPAPCTLSFQLSEHHLSRRSKNDPEKPNIPSNHQGCCFYRLLLITVHSLEHIKLNTTNKRTFALVNCTIGPSSDTTWFPTWMKGILPADGNKTQRPQSNNTKSMKGWCNSTQTNLKGTCILHLLCTPPPPEDRTSWGRSALERNKTWSVCINMHQILNIRKHFMVILQVYYKKYSLKLNEQKLYLDSKRRGAVWQQDLIF